MCVCVCVCVGVRACVRAYVRVYVRTYVRAYVYACMHAGVYVCFLWLGVRLHFAYAGNHPDGRPLLHDGVRVQWTPVADLR